LLKNEDNKNNYLCYRDFSKRIENELLDALVKTTHSCLQVFNTKKKIPIQVIMAGGDDVLAIMPADWGPAFALELDKTFNRKDNTFNDKRLTLSMGMIIAKSSFPIRELVDRATELLKSAKVRGKNSTASKPATAIDFAVAKTPMIKPISISRPHDQCLGPQDDPTHLTAKPYSSANFKQLCINIGKLKHNRFPKSKLKALFNIIYSGRFNGMFDGLNLLTRLTPKAKNTMFEIQQEFELDYFPWRKRQTDSGFETVLADMIELYDYVSEAHCGNI
jgi:hypothetical protein